MNTFSLKITTCDRVFYDGECESLIFPVFDGLMAIMANHQSMTTCTEIGEIKFRTPDGEEHIAIVSEGFLKVHSNSVKFLVFSAETPDEIDASRAQMSLERAEERLRHKQSNIEYHLTRASLSRAMARLSGKDKYLLK